MYLDEKPFLTTVVKDLTKEPPGIGISLDVKVNC